MALLYVRSESNHNHSNPNPFEEGQKPLQSLLQLCLSLAWCRHNIAGSTNLMEAMRKHNVKTVLLSGTEKISHSVQLVHSLMPSHGLLCLISNDTAQFESPAAVTSSMPAALQMVFSSSCTVYGEPAKVPIDETFPRKAVSPYGNTKLVIEDIMTGDFSQCYWHFLILFILVYL